MNINHAKLIEDTEIVAWEPSSGVTLYDKLDEEVPDDSDYIVSTATTNTSKFKLSPLKKAIEGRLVVKFRAKSSDGTRMTVQLLEGSTLIAERLYLDVSQSGYQQFGMVLTQAEIALITNASALYLNFIGEHFIFILLGESGDRIALEDGTGVLLMENA
jgi:hypothetical protein